MWQSAKRKSANLHDKSANTQISLFVRRKRIYFKSAKILGPQIHKLKIGKSQKRLGSQIRKVPNLRNLRKSNKLFRSANLQICLFQNIRLWHWNVGWIEKEAANMYEQVCALHKGSRNKHRWQTERGLCYRWVVKSGLNGIYSYLPVKITVWPLVKVALLLAYWSDPNLFDKIRF